MQQQEQRIRGSGQRRSGIGNPPHTVLVVDDEHLLRLAIAGYLRDRGLRVLEASTAGEAVAVLSSNHVDVVFSDVWMPGSMNGFGLAQWIRAHRPHTPVMLTSGCPQTIDEREFPDETAPIAKPYDQGDVADRIRSLLPA